MFRNGFRQPAFADDLIKLRSMTQIVQAYTPQFTFITQENAFAELVHHGLPQVIFLYGIIRDPSFRRQSPTGEKGYISIRIYNDSNAAIHLERKMKQGGYIVDLSKPCLRIAQRSIRRSNMQTIRSL